MGKDVKFLFLLALLFPLIVGATVIVKEGEKEVGKYEDGNGKSDEIKILQLEGANSANKKVLPMGSLSGYASGLLLNNDINICNQSEFDWTNCSLKVRVGTQGDAYIFSVAQIPAAPQSRRTLVAGQVYNPGETKNIQAGNFIRSDGTRLILDSSIVTTLSAKCAEGTWDGEVDIN